MEEFDRQMSENTNCRGVGRVLYGSPVLAPASGFNIHTGNYFDQSDGQHHPIVKMEAGTSQNRGLRFHYPPVVRSNPTVQDHRRRSEIEAVDAIKAKIVAHPQYSNLLEAYVDCQKLGAPPEEVARLASVRQEYEERQRATSGTVSKDPELDQFMEAYYDMLVKYRDELSRPLQESMEFMRRVEAQLKILTINSPVGIFNPGKREDKLEAGGNLPEEEQENDGLDLPGIDPRAEDRELKNQLMKKYSGYFSSLKQELSKKKKKGKLPKDARQKLLSWWELHYKWPYPSESEKLGLAESTGLDHKQINNWFINQRKRHWKPSEDMQFMVMEQHGATFYMDGNCMSNAPYRLEP